MFSQRVSFLRIGMIAIGVFCVFVTTRANVLRNPGFEEGWNHWELVSGSASINNSSFAVRNGSQALLTTGIGIVHFKQTGVPIEPYTYYKLISYSKVVNTGGGAELCAPYFWTKFYIDGVQIYHAYHGWRSWRWETQDWVVFNTEGRNEIDISIERYATCFPPGTQGISFDDMVLTPHDTTRPIMLSAELSEGEVQEPGIDDDDYVTIAFSEPTNKVPMQRFFDGFEHIIHPIDIVLKLGSGHTWLDGSGSIGGAECNEPGDTLIIYLSTNGGPPTIEVGDLIRPGRGKITDEWGNPLVRSEIELTSCSIFEDIQKQLTSVHFKLLQNHPNPFYSATLISYQIPEKEWVSLKVYNVSGNLVTILVNKPQAQGSYTVPWDGRDRVGREVPSGIYLYRLKVGEFDAARKTILLRR